MNWLDKLNLKKISWLQGEEKENVVPEGLWIKCHSCQSTLYRSEVEKQNYVCPKCDYHMRIEARTRLKLLFDTDSYYELDAPMKSVDILKFKDSQRYTDRISKANKKTGEKEALISMEGKINGMNVVACAFEFSYMGGSMGSVVGEKFTRAANRSLETHSPLICFAASGGARMQESMHSLMQMAKTSAVIKKLQKNRIPFISVLTDPTMGGVSASLAMLGDIIIAEPNAEIGFAGRRVIEQTVREVLPDDFQKSEFLLENGAIDLIINRSQLKHKLYQILSMIHQQQQQF